MGANIGEIWILDDLVIDVGRQRVARAEEPVQLTKLSFKLLIELVRSAPDVVSVEELMDRVWSDSTVNPETVTQRVKLLRNALGDDARAPRYIVGVYGQGYQFCGQVSRVDTPHAEDADEAVPPLSADGPVAPGSVPRSRQRRRLTFVIAGILSLAFVATVVGFNLIARHRVLASAPSVERTVAVLPFKNVNLAQADAHIAIGIPEVILGKLSRIGGLYVVARGASFRISRPVLDPFEIGRRLNAAYLVEGSVQHSAGILRVMVRIIDAGRNMQIWSQNFDGKIENLYALQDEVADTTAAALRSKLPGPNPRSSTSPKARIQIPIRH